MSGEWFDKNQNPQLVVNAEEFVLLIGREKKLLSAGFKLYGDHKLPAALPQLHDITVSVVVMEDALSALPERRFFIGSR